MIECMPESNDDLVVIHALGTLSDADYGIL